MNERIRLSKIILANPSVAFLVASVFKVEANASKAQTVFLAELLFMAQLLFLAQ